MKKLLPKTINNPQGFTLIELLVVVTILAILGTIGISVFSGAQKNARDGKSKADIDLIAKTIETSRKIDTLGAVTYKYASTDATADFKTAPSGTRYAYCIKSSTSAVVTSNPTAGAAWTSSACEAAGGTWNKFGAAAGDIADGSKYWRVCARLEDDTTTYCKDSMSQ